MLPLSYAKRRATTCYCPHPWGTSGAAGHCQLLAGIWLKDMKQVTTEVTHSDGKGRERVEKHIDPSQRSSAWQITFLSRQLLPQPWQHGDPLPQLGARQQRPTPAGPGEMASEELSFTLRCRLCSPGKFTAARLNLPCRRLAALRWVWWWQRENTPCPCSERGLPAEPGRGVMPSTRLRWAEAAPGAATTPPANISSTCGSCQPW